MEMSHQKREALTAGIAGSAVAIAVTLLVDWGTIADAVDPPAIQLRGLGIELLERSMLLFETAGVSILVAMIAAVAVAIARSRES